jgi:hypothetical protein
MNVVYETEIVHLSFSSQVSKFFCHTSSQKPSHRSWSPKPLLATILATLQMNKGRQIVGE